MLPSQFVVLDTLPLTPNGKIDRRALPAVLARPADGSDTVRLALRSPTEEAVAAVWHQVLGPDRQFGVEDNFFEVGGHSLLALEVHAGLQARFGAGLSVVDLFRYPTITTLAQHLDSNDRRPAASAIADVAARQRQAFGRHKQMQKKRSAPHEQ
jgi:hypothetical protein